MTAQPATHRIWRRRGFVLEIGAATHVGGRRDNQDAYGWHVAGDRLFVVVADGMGGGIDGQRFSQLAVSTVLEALRRDARVRFEDAMQEAIDALHRLRASSPDYERSGSTIVAAEMTPGAAGFDVHVISIGDSPALLLGADGRLAQLTRDHTYAQQLMSGGTPMSEAHSHYQAARLTHALGDELHLEDVPYSRPHGRRLHELEALILCTDGVSKVIGEAEMIQTRGLNAGVAAQMMVDQSLARVLGDNATALVVRCRRSRVPQLTAVIIGFVAALAALLVLTFLVISAQPDPASAPRPVEATVTPIQRGSPTVTRDTVIREPQREPGLVRPTPALATPAPAPPGDGGTAPPPTPTTSEAQPARAPEEQP
jgi:serine/threonine protein phosphatase PrpC